MIKYIKKDSGVETEFVFVPSTTLPSEFPVSTPLTFAFIGENLVITQKENGWWDVPGGKVEAGESWLEALHREVKEECGVAIDHVRLVGYILAKNSGYISSISHAPVNVLPVTISFVQSVDANWIKRETLKRDAPARDTVRELFAQRNDSGQLLEIFNFVVNDYKSQGYTCTFEYVKDLESTSRYPVTQSVVFIKNSENKFIVVREEDQNIFTLPGGGCHMDESGLECAVRESYEEAQVKITNPVLLGRVVVKIFQGEVLLSVSAQERYVANIGEMVEFIPNKDGFETVERKLIEFANLKSEAHILNNPTGDQILENLKNYL